jgi:hypothetical protein
MAQVVEALRYTPEGSGFDSRWCQSFRQHYGPGVDSAPNKNEYQEYCLGVKCGRYVRLAMLPPLCAACLEIWEPQTHRTLNMDSFTFTCLAALQSL